MNTDKKHFFENKIQMIIYISIFLVLLFAFIFLGTRNYKNASTNDNLQFDQEFSLVDKDNVFNYVKSTDVRTMLNKGNGIIFFGFNTSVWVNNYAKILNETAKESGILKISYYDFYKDRKEKNGTYETIVSKLSYYLKTNDEGIQNINAPTLLVIKDGNIIYFDDETAITEHNITPADFWTDDKINEKKAELKQVFLQFLGDTDGK